MLLFIIVAILGFVNSQKPLLELYEGDKCKSESGVDWICRSVNDCKHINFKATRPSICSFTGQLPIICCQPPPMRISEKKCKEFMAQRCPLATISRITRDIGGALFGISNSLTNIILRKNSTIQTTETLLSTTETYSSTTKTYEFITEKMTTEANVPKVQGGVAAKGRNHRHMALLGFGISKDQVEWNCGGSLISERHILTAAHCGIGTLGKPKWARVGELDLSTDTDDARPEDRNIVEWISHPNYNSKTVYNDIAICKLDQNVKLSEWVAPACLHSTFDIPSANATVTGFGRLDFTSDTSSALQEVTISLVNGRDCRRLYGDIGSSTTPEGINATSQICAGEQEGGKDACSGDSGGPMVIEIPGRCLKTQIGITSFGKNCGLPNTPGIYTRVSHYLDWIENIVWPKK